MFRIKWDPEINGIILADALNDNDVVNSPRPVYFEELDLLGFNKYWTYPQSKEPLLWAIGRKYFYAGVFVAEAKGGNLYEAPEIIITEDGNNLKLKPINIKKVIARNKKSLFVLENEAIDFVEDTFRKYKNKVDFVTVSFSGGKDSQVVLDIVSRVLHPEDYIVIFSDTTMEIPYTYEAVERTSAEYKKRYPKLKFYTVKPVKDSLELWKYFGPPSRFHRWCCTVTKTAPFVKKVRELYEEKGGKKTPRILVFEGVRKEESAKRSNYTRLGLGVKHVTIINARPIIEWNLTEIYIYSMFREILLNYFYRVGATRVGCSICPFSSDWSEFILNERFPGLTNKYLSLIKEFAKNSGINTEEKVKDYLIRGQWKKRAGGQALELQDTWLDFRANNGDQSIEAVLSNPREEFTEWVKVMGSIMHIEEKGTIKGEIKAEDSIHSFEIKNQDGNEKTLKVWLNSSNENLKARTKKLFYKTTYCVHCGACEAECPTAALKTYPKVSIDSHTCIHCYNCLDFTEKGCLVAKSINDNRGGKIKEKTVGIDRYSTFGLRDEWLSSYLSYGTQWLQENNLGPNQKLALINWLKEAELIGPTDKNATVFMEKIKKIKENKVIWSLILVNLYYNSPIVNWYLNKLEWGSSFSKADLLNKLKSDFGNLLESTLNNPLSALINLFDNSLLGKDLNIGLLEKKGRVVRKVIKKGTDDVKALPIIYSLYKLSERLNRKDFTIREIFTDDIPGGPYKIFDISIDKLERVLVVMQEKQSIVRVELKGGLDNLFLKANMSSLDVIDFLLKDYE